MIEAKVILDSVSEDLWRLTTMELTYPRFIHSEFLTHRVFSRNSASSRAIPVRKQIKKVWNYPAVPIHFGMNQPGMQASVEATPVRKWIAKKLWIGASKIACIIAWLMMRANIHKQVVNRILEPFCWHTVIVTSTDYENFFNLRDHPDAQPEIRELARKMSVAYRRSYPTPLLKGQWHMPYIQRGEYNTILDYDILTKISAARCARVSYLTHDGKRDYKKDLELYDKLTSSVPRHDSPLEHVATPAHRSEKVLGNFTGWHQLRHWRNNE